MPSPFTVWETICWIRTCRVSALHVDLHYATFLESNAMGLLVSNSRLVGALVFNALPRQHRETSFGALGLHWPPRWASCPGDDLRRDVDGRDRLEWKVGRSHGAAPECPPLAPA
jgi:hypothetical protein